MFGSNCGYQQITLGIFEILLCFIPHENDKIFIELNLVLFILIRTPKVSI